MKPLRKLKAEAVLCWVIYAYKPYRTKKGHFVWRKAGEVAGPLSPRQLADSPYAKIGTGRIHNKKLTDEEEIKALALEENDSL